MYVEAARSLAQRIRVEGGENIEDQIQFGFQLCVARPPSDFEKKMLLDLYQSQLQADENVESSEDGTAVDRDNALYSVAMVLMNMHETVTKD